MSILSNNKHEHFAQEVAKGVSGTIAYQSAYPKAASASARANASKLLSNAIIRDRVYELQANRADMAAKASAEAAGELRITAVWLMEKAEDARRGAMEAGQHAAAVSAIKELGILSGHRVEKRENTNRTLNDLSDDELARIAFGGGERDSTAPGGSALSH